MNDNSVSLSDIDTIDVIEEIEGGVIYYTECPGQCVRCDGRNRRNAKERCDEGIGEDHVRINLTVITQFIWRREI